MRTVYRILYSFTSTSNGFYYEKGREILPSEYWSLPASERDHVEIVKQEIKFEQK